MATILYVGTAGSDDPTRAMGIEPFAPPDIRGLDLTSGALRDGIRLR